MMVSTRTTEFDDIRPYRDDEVRGALDRLSCDREFIDLILGMKQPWLQKYCPGLGHWLTRLSVRRLFARFNTVKDFQQLVANQLGGRMKTASEKLTALGVDKLRADQAYLFISNHRDIAMDPAMLDLVMVDNARETVRIAIGDNLLTKPFASDLMRINQSFIVKRSSMGRREKLAALRQLSAYIRYSVCEESCSIWLAQREGRAKDGIDSTETAVLKMLALSKSEGQNLGEALAELNIIPVSISYEYDPCDGYKAHELHVLRSEGSYDKGEHEDLKSIYSGIMGYKGHVFVAFGEPLPGGLETAEEVAAAIDQQIIGNYQLQANHFIAYELQHGTDAQFEQLKLAIDVDWNAKAEIFRQRLAAIPEVEQDIFIAMYANPVAQRLQQMCIEEPGEQRQSIA